MRFAAATLALLLAAAAGSASAQATRLPDTGFLRLARCAGLVAGSGGDPAALDAAVRQNRMRRADYVRDQAINNRAEAASEMRSASGASRERLTAEMQACQA